MTDVDPYVDRNGVFLNSLGLTSADVLARAEADLSFAALLRLSMSPLPGSYDLDHLRRFHRAIFGAVYPWAGELRRVDITRSHGDMFCRWQFIESYSAGVFAELGAEGYLRKLARNAFVERALPTTTPRSTPSTRSVRATADHNVPSSPRSRGTQAGGSRGPNSIVRRTTRHLRQACMVTHGHYGICWMVFSDRCETPRRHRPAGSRAGARRRPA